MDRINLVGCNRAYGRRNVLVLTFARDLDDADVQQLRDCIDNLRPTVARASRLHRDEAGDGHA